MPAIILSDNGATSGSAGLKTSGGNDGVLQLQTTTSGGTPTTAISISNTQVVTYTNQPTYTGGTANGVLYLNGSKAVTSGTALVFDGTNLGVGITPVSSKLHVKQTTTAQGIKLESNANDSQIAIYNNNADPEWRVTATYGSTGSFQPLTFWTSDTKRLTLDTSGNLGLGVTPSAWWSSGKAYQVGSRTSLSDLTGDTHVTNNAFFDGTNWKYITSNAAGNYYQYAGTHVWRYAGSGTAGANVAWTQAMTLDASGNLGVGTTNPAGYRLRITASGSTGLAVTSVGSNSANPTQDWFDSTNNTEAVLACSSGKIDFGAYSNSPLVFLTNNTERARIDTSGNLLVGITTSAGWGGRNRIYRNETQGTAILSIDNGTEYSGIFFSVTTGGYSSAGAAQWIARNGGTSRSINASGTINASGADYAEYMTKAGDFTVAKGDVVGINADGKLTNMFADAATFVVKSTEPSYVGNDTWGVGFEGNQEGLEAARQLVDRIAFAGQVPVNVTGATAGQYIIPVNDNGTIKGVAVSNPTFEQYQQAVGKVIAIEQDGRARIIVKVA